MPSHSGTSHCVEVTIVSCDYGAVAAAQGGYRELGHIYHRVCYIVGGGIYMAITQLLPQLWFYEHTTIFSNQDGERYPRLVSKHKVDHGGMYDATELLAEPQESEVKFHVYVNVIACEDR